MLKNSYKILEMIKKDSPYYEPSFLGIFINIITKISGILADDINTSASVAVALVTLPQAIQHHIMLPECQLIFDDSAVDS